jgi:mRNA-degrading endonuclease RelE of RelBE toxin-antitoxin system
MWVLESAAIAVDYWRVLYAVDDDRREIWIQDVRRRSKVHGGH